MCATSSKATDDPGGLIDRKLSACIFTLHVISPACYGWMLDLSMSMFPLKPLGLYL